MGLGIGQPMQKRPAKSLAGRSHVRESINYSDSISSSMFTGIGAFSSSIGITLEGVSGRGG
jgi:hypothetical protein